ncbi:MAG: hypothetical protein JXN59_01985 [Anaerolineae bacterium]|nr:hypothetical protein [Anaerolineae bacterium]
MPAIPAPELVGDALAASLYTIAGHVIAVLGPQTPPTNRQLKRAFGPLVIRYALPYLNRETAIVPGLFASEYGAILVGWDGWNYAMTHSNLHPRADLLGLRTDAQPDQVMLRDIDFGRGVEVWAYETPDARTPIGRLAAWEGASPPDHLAEYLPHVSHLTARLADMRRNEAD